MKDEDFDALKLKLSIIPTQLNWPEPVMYDYWKRLHEAADTARDKTAAALAAMDAVDHNNDLTAVGKAKARTKIAEQAIADLEKSDALKRAQTAVEHQNQWWADKLGDVVKPAEDVHTAMLYGKILDRVAAMDAPARMAFLSKHADDQMVSSALLTAPGFLSGMSEPEISMVRSKIEKGALSPEVLEARGTIEKALRETTHGWARAATMITERGGLKAQPVLRKTEVV